MDVISDVLQSIRLTAAVFFDLRAHAPWVGMTPHAAEVSSLILPKAEQIICFHILVSGDGWATLDDEDVAALPLKAGDVLIVSKGDRHYLSSAPGMRAEAEMDAYRSVPGKTLPIPHTVNETAAEPETCHFVCGYLGCDRRPFNPLLESLPRLLHAKASAASQAWLSSLLQTAVEETEDDGAGRQVMLSKLAELIFVDVLRTYTRALPDGACGWLSGLRDRHVGIALQLIHTHPADDWTLPRLARETGLSRSSLAERFAHLVGVPPMEYLAKWRMQLAARRLVQNVEISRVAFELGYDSEASFSRVFKRVVGMPPGAWRRASQLRRV